MAALTLTALDLAEQGHDSGSSNSPTLETSEGGRVSNRPDRRDPDRRDKAFPDGDSLWAAIAARESRRAARRPSCRRTHGRSCSVEIQSTVRVSCREPRTGGGTFYTGKRDRGREHMEFLGTCHLSARCIRSGDPHSRHLCACS